MATVWERDAHSADRQLSLNHYFFINLVISNLGLGQALSLFVTVPGHCLLVYFRLNDPLMSYSPNLVGKTDSSDIVFCIYKVT